MQMGKLASSTTMLYWGLKAGVELPTDVLDRSFRNGVSDTRLLVIQLTLIGEKVLAIEVITHGSDMTEGAMQLQSVHARTY